MNSRFHSIEDVVEAKLCSGCGACAYVQPEEIKMVDVPAEGLRPRIVKSSCGRLAETAEALKVCPGIELEHEDLRGEESINQEMIASWGPIRSIWEGAASNDELRFAGSSGGAASALAVYALERLGFRLVLHIEANPDAPYTNRTVVSTTREEVLSRTGSRYAPASPCERLALIEQAEGPCVFIGKPCDVAATQRARKHRPQLDRNLALAVAFFCAGTPSTNGTLELLRSVGIANINDLGSVRYRGNGWPGRFVAEARDGATYSCSYDESWGGVLSKHVQWRCKLCLDHTGEFADIAVGDPWYRSIAPDEPGSSLIVARSGSGERFLQMAIDDRAIVASRVDPSLLPKSQPNLLRTRGEVWGRMLGARLVGARTPNYRRLPSFRQWLSAVPLPRKARSVVGSMRRSVRQGTAFKSLAP